MAAVHINRTMLWLVWLPAPFLPTYYCGLEPELVLPLWLRRLPSCAYRRVLLFLFLSTSRMVRCSSYTL